VWQGERPGKDNQTVNGVFSWIGSWAWGLPLIVLNVSLHVIGLGFINAKIIEIVGLMENRRHVLFTFAVVMGTATLSATVLHGIEATVWAGAYLISGALSDIQSSMLYSLGAITTYGNTNVVLGAHWRLLGALEALNGIMLFGLTTALLYGLIQRVWPIESRTHHR
jgi:hypothetical protein